MYLQIQLTDHHVYYIILWRQGQGWGLRQAADQKDHRMKRVCQAAEMQFFIKPIVSLTAVYSILMARFLSFLRVQLIVSKTTQNID